MLSRIEPPVLALTLAEAKRQVRLTDDEHEHDDDLLALLVDVQSMTESELRCGLTNTRYRETLSAFPKSPWYLQRGRVTAITSLRYVDPMGNTQTMTDYTLTESGALARISPEPMPGVSAGANSAAFPAITLGPGAVIVEYVSGFGEPAEVPDSIKRWMKLQIGNWFANREAADARALAANPFLDALIAEYRVQAYL